MKKIILGIVILFSTSGCFVNTDVAVEIDEQKPEVEEAKVVVEEEKTEVLPSFSQDYIDELGESTFILPEKILENGDKEYVFEPFGMRFTVPAKYSKFYPMDSIWGEWEDTANPRYINFLENFESAPVGDGGEAISLIEKVDKNKYDEFKKNIKELGGKEIGAVEIGDFDLQKFEYSTFGSNKIFNYFLKSGDEYYQFHVLGRNNEFMMEVIKSIKF
ncbi:hypothetical protein M0P48_02040 [Candidatus Gracilibacteria bacterium]|nr:hypothetical protein [Candidatus Gracilibacteria bacterium]